MIGDRRGEDSPPVDMLAEAVVLTRMIQQPALIDQYDVGHMLTSPDHRAIWESLTRVRRVFPDVDGRQFIVEWLSDIGAHHPRTWLDLVDLISPQEELDRAWEEYELAHETDPGAVLMRSDFDHPFSWWLARLVRVAESRRLLSKTQVMSDALWREDVETARGVAAEIGLFAVERNLPHERVIDRLDV